MATAFRRARFRLTTLRYGHDSLTDKADNTRAATAHHPRRTPVHSPFNKHQSLRHAGKECQACVTHRVSAQICHGCRRGGENDGNRGSRSKKRVPEAGSTRVGSTGDVPSGHRSCGTIRRSSTSTSPIPHSESVSVQSVLSFGSRSNSNFVHVDA